jgi:phage shock protein PspC (stress-responsive transcriptional regulator)
MNDTSTYSEPVTTTTNPESGLPAGSRPLYRPKHDRMLAGVASGIARYLHVDVLLVRIALVIVTFVGGIGVPLYLACWLLIPDEGTDQSLAAGFVSDMNAWRN